VTFHALTTRRDDLRSPDRVIFDLDPATLLSWDEVDDATLIPRRWTLRDVPQRIADRGDPWQGMGRRVRPLGPARRRLER